MMATLGSRKADSTTRWRALVLYVSVALLATLIGGHLLGLWSAGLDTPGAYRSDTLLTSAIWKGIIDEGQPYTNPSLGAPGVGQMYDFPGADGLLNLEVWLLARFTSDYAVLLNLFALLTFPLIALTAAWSMRKLRMSRMAAFVFAILFACLPFHQTRIDGHQYLSAYFVVPLAIALIVDVVLDMGRRCGGAPARSAWRLPLWAWLVAVALGSCGVYYAYFGIVLTVLAGTIAAYSARDSRRLVPAALVVGIVVLVLAVQYAPS
jgi:phosphoglycerol transferase